MMCPNDAVISRWLGCFWLNGCGRSKDLSRPELGTVCHGIPASMANVCNGAAC